MSTFQAAENKVESPPKIISIWLCMCFSLWKLEGVRDVVEWECNCVWVTEHASTVINKHTEISHLFKGTQD